MVRRAAMVLGLLIFGFAANPVQGQTTTDPGGRVVRAVRLEAPLSLDGVLDEAVYRQVAPLSGFVQYEPANGQPATEGSDAWVFFDAKNVYISVRNWDSHPERAVANELRHDSTTLTQNEQVTITLDTFHDRRNGFVFLVSALGGLLEEAFADERNANRDWNAIWDARVARFDGGWSAELRIPFASLRYRADDTEWGIQIGRSIKWKNEITFLAPLPVLAGPPVYRISYGATLTGLELPTPPIRPATKLWATTGVHTTRSFNGGGDFKSAIGRGLTADLTLNTDFAQVEEDEQQVNLSRFALFFPEKREFFLEGQGVFNFGGQGSTTVSDVPVMFFSRTIGFARGLPQDILAGGRLTGKAGPYGIGLMAVQTRDNADSGAAGLGTSVIRVRRDVLRNSSVGILLTDRSRSESGRGRNVLAGMDGVFTLTPYLRVNTYAARTVTAGLGDAAWSYRGQFDYAGDRYGAMVERLGVGRDFNPEAGFMRRRAFTKTAVGLRFSPRPAPGGTLVRLVRKFAYELPYNYYQRPDGALDSYDVAGIARAEFQNGDSAQVQFTANADRVPTPFSLAPGIDVPVGEYAWRSVQSTYVLGARRRLSGTFTALAGSFYEGTQQSASYRGRFAVVTRLAIEPSVSFNRVVLPQGELLTTLLSSRVTTPLTPRMFASALVQYNSLGHSFSSSLRFRWEYRPGSEMFVVYSGSRERRAPTSPEIETHALAFKITRTLG